MAVTAVQQYKYCLYIKKRQIFLELFIAIGRKLPLNCKKVITILGEALFKQTQKKTLVMLNISTKVNIINQQFAIKYNFKILNAKLFIYFWLNKT